MFTQIITEIKREIEWINMERGRQSTSKKQDGTLALKKERLNEIMALCMAYESQPNTSTN